MAFNRTMRRVLFYSMLPVLLFAFVITYSLEQPIILAGGVILAVTMFFLSLQRIVCPKCGFAHRTIDVELKHCYKCGAEYLPSD
jgi:hypothetical protein